MDASTLAVLIAGAAAAGFVNGLAGFGTALFSLGFWLQILPPIHAVALGVVTATVTGLQGLLVVRHEIFANPGRLMRFLVPAIFGIPLGVLALSYVEPRLLKLLIAGFLLLYGVYFIARRSLPKFERPTPWIDAGVGLSGGFLGGLAGLSGALPAMWCGLRPWPRRELRAVLQPYNTLVLALSAVTLAVNGVYTAQVLKDLAIVLVVAIVAAQIGMAVFRRMNDVQFRWLLIVLMFVSGAVLMLRELI